MHLQSNVNSLASNDTLPLLLLGMEYFVTSQLVGLTVDSLSSAKEISDIGNFIDAHSAIRKTGYVK